MSETDDAPITLAEACKLFPRARLTLSTLRAEAARGRLDIFRIGRRDYTTPQAMREMVRKCRVEPKAPGFTLIPGASPGLSETDQASSALAAAKETVLRLKSSSRNTSATSTSRSRQARH